MHPRPLLISFVFALVASLKRMIKKKRKTHYFDTNVSAKERITKHKNIGVII